MNVFIIYIYFTFYYFCNFYFIATIKDDEKKDVAAAGGGLKRGIGLLAAINIIISVMIGSGIFVSPTAALRYSGSIGFCLIVWTACGIISLLGKNI